MAKARRVAIMIDLKQPFSLHLGVLTGTRHYADRAGNWHCVVDPFAHETLEQRKATRIAGYDGVIGFATPELMQAAQRWKVPVVNLMTKGAGLGAPSALPDLALAGRMAAEHLLQRGCRHFAYLGFRDNAASRMQWSGMRQALAAAGIKARRLMVGIALDATARRWWAFRGRLAEWIRTWPTPIGAIAVTDLLGRYLADAIDEAGYAIPDDVALIGTGNSAALCSQLRPTLTSVDLGYEQVGWQAAALLDRMMRGEAPPGEPLLLPPLELVPRESTEGMAVDDPRVAAAMQFMLKHGGEPIRVTDIAAHAGLSRRSLERRFLRAIKRTAAEQLTRLRLERVKHLLAATRLPVKTIAYDCGFTSAALLSNVFRRIEGHSPLTYRKNRQVAGIPLPPRETGPVTQ